MITGRIFPTNQTDLSGSQRHADLAADLSRQGSLSQFVVNHIRSAATRHWLRVIEPVVSEDRLLGRGVDLAFVKIEEARAHIPPMFERHAVDAVAASLQPAMNLHEAGFGGELALIKVLYGKDRNAELFALAPFPDAFFGTNLDAFKLALEDTYRRLGADLLKTTIYRHQLGGSFHTDAFVRGGIERSLWRGFNHWHYEMKRRFDIDVHLKFDTKRDRDENDALDRLARHFRGVQPSSEGVRIISAPLRSPAALPLKWRNFAEDWRARNFFSVDRPEVGAEDAMNFAERVSYAVPLKASSAGPFLYNKDIISIAAEALMAENGAPIDTKVTLAVVRNRLIPGAREVDRIFGEIGANRNADAGQDSYAGELPHLYRQVGALMGAAERSLRRQMELTSSIQLEIEHDGEKRNEPVSIRKGEFAVQQVTRFAQRAFAEWFSVQSDNVPFLVSRPHMTSIDALNEVREIVPWVSAECLQDPKRRHVVVQHLLDNGRKDLVSVLARALSEARFESELVVLESGEQLGIHDTSRMKAAHRPYVGSVNQIQAMGILLGAPSFSRADLEKCADAVNRRDDILKGRFALKLEAQLGMAREFLKRL